MATTRSDDAGEKYKRELADLQNRFSYHPANTEFVKQSHDNVRNECFELASFLLNIPEGRERSLALTHLEEVMFWANAAIARKVK